MGNIEGYIEQGLSQRNEIDKIETDIQVKEAEIEKLRQYFGRSSDRYKDATNELELLQIDREKTISDVELNIRDAYMNYELKAADRLIKEADLDDVKRQYKEAELSVELGYSVASTLDNLNALVEQKTKAYDAANRDYEVAISALNNASSFGPAYTSSTAAPGM